ncbi:hypothetical protein BLNAU_22321 [Blattamonas nauphoetae]|uniref:Uncharacterized protein n=1 Tax=Blattamonas nauphoetae TaxID=2049346 RepID=A0ABQ9WTE5_9EUKA|nr:hypothetical protein BLNAU_22321 [Blattamonas nauphoetae]
MGSTSSRHLQLQNDQVPSALVPSDMSIFRKLQIIIDSCVGILQRDDFLDFESELDNAQLSDLSRFCYQSFSTSAGERNEHSPLKSYIFRSSTYSLFGHIIANAQIYETGRRLYNRSSFSDPFPGFLNVVTGTPGMGKSASRYPFITLLMCIGVKAITTKKEGEGTFVFSKQDEKLIGMVNIKTESEYGPVDFETPSFLNIYDVSYFEPDKVPETPEEKTGKTKKKDTLYIPSTYQNERSKEKTSQASLLGQISVPSVEYFPYFIRLLIGLKPPEQKQEIELPKDIHITKPCKLAAESEIEEGSVLHIIKPPERQTGKYHLQERKILLKDSILTKDSYLFRNLINPDTIYIDGSTQRRINKQTPSKIGINQLTITEYDQIVEPKSFFNSGSVLYFRDLNATVHTPPKMETINEDKEIAAGSLIKKGSKIAARSTLTYGYSIQNILKDTTWHIIDEFVVISLHSASTAPSSSLSALPSSLLLPRPVLILSECTSSTRLNSSKWQRLRESQSQNPFRLSSPAQQLSSNSSRCARRHQRASFPCSARC